MQKSPDPLQSLVEKWVLVTGVLHLRYWRPLDRETEIVKRSVCTLCMFGSVDGLKVCLQVPAREFQVVRFVHAVDAIDVERRRIGHEPQFDGCRNQQVNKGRTTNTINSDDISAYGPNK